MRLGWGNGRFRSFTTVQRDQEAERNMKCHHDPELRGLRGFKEATCNCWGRPRHEPAYHPGYGIVDMQGGVLEK